MDNVNELIKECLIEKGYTEMDEKLTDDDSMDYYYKDVLALELDTNNIETAVIMKLFDNFSIPGRFFGVQVVMPSWVFEISVNNKNIDLKKIILRNIDKLEEKLISDIQKYLES